MNRLQFQKLKLEGLFLITREDLGDERGFLSRFWCSHEMRTTGWLNEIAQINFTFNKESGTVRGMHFQKRPYGEKKLISCLKGAIWDVAADLRPDSPTYLKWHAEELTEKNKKAFLIPEGFAHGYQTLTDDVELLYCHSKPFNKDSEGGVNPTDPLLEIEWPSEITVISSRDSNHPLIDDNFNGIQL